MSRESECKSREIQKETWRDRKRGRDQGRGTEPEGMEAGFLTEP